MPDVKCTCFPIHYDDHDYDCDLWSVPDFQVGDAWWSPIAEDLFTSSEFIDMAPDLLHTQELRMLETGYNDALRIGEMIREWGLDFWDDLLEPEQAEPVEITPAHLIGCTCEQVPPVTGDHPKTCEIWKNPDWYDRKCEWVPGAGLRWYADDKGWSENKVPLLAERPAWAAAVKPAAKADDAWSWSDYGGAGVWSKDRHYEEVVTFPDGTTVLGSSEHQRKANESVPDYGLYLDPSWTPQCLATMLPWRDYGLPTIRFDQTAATIVEHFELARQGFAVEVGCIGGHGRTGTVLACMAVLAGVRSLEAVAWIRANYCKHAVEKPEQEWFVAWFAAHLNGTDVPPFVTQQRTSAEPAPSPAPKTTSWRSVTTSKDTPSAPSKSFANTRRYGCPSPLCDHRNTEGQMYVCNSMTCAHRTVTSGSRKGKKLMRQVTFVSSLTKSGERKEVMHHKEEVIPT